MRTSIPRLLVVVVSMVFVLVASADEPDVKSIKTNLARALPNTNLDGLKLRPSPVSGLLEAELGTEVFYVAPDGKHIIFGDLIDVESRHSVTEGRRQILVAGVLKEAPEKDMILVKPAETKRTITVFTDVDCGFCRRLHLQDVPQLTKNGVQVRYLLFPRDRPGTETYNHSISVWCAPDRLKAVGDAKAGKAVPAKTCAHPVDRNVALAGRVGVSGTPAIFLEDGRRLPGYVPADQLLVMLGLKAQSPSTPR